MPVTKLVDYSVDIRVLDGAVLNKKGFNVDSNEEYAFVSYRGPRRGGETVVSGPIPREGAAIMIRA